MAPRHMCCTLSIPLKRRSRRYPFFSRYGTMESLTPWISSLARRLPATDTFCKQSTAGPGLRGVSLKRCNSLHKHEYMHACVHMEMSICWPLQTRGVEVSIPHSTFHVSIFPFGNSPRGNPHPYAPRRHSRLNAIRIAPRIT